MRGKSVYILLTDTGTLFTRAIKLYTRNPYNHASIAFDENLTEVYSFGRKNPRNPFIGGFVEEDIKEGLYKQATGVIYRLNVSEHAYDKMREYIQAIDDQREDYRYNLLGLIAIIFNIPLNRENAFFCSQFVAAVLQQSESVDLNKPLAFIKPHDLQGLTDLQLVYEGSLHHYMKRHPNCSLFLDNNQGVC